jgi:glycolate oxidase FAD binding subunit
VTAGAIDRVLDLHQVEIPDGAPDARWAVAPDTLEAVADVLAAAAAAPLRVLVWGGGTHQGMGYRVDPDVVLVTRRLDRVVDWQPDDLTLVVEGGLGVAALDDLLAERSQTAVLPEQPGAATVGGAVAAAASTRRRLRYGPIRDRMLEATVVTGDGRVVTAGGRVVKNVSGFDIPRLVTGSFGALGVIGRVCLKLWPGPGATATVAVDDPGVALATAYRPAAVLETEGGTKVFLEGTQAEVEAQAVDLGGAAAPGHAWPAPVEAPWRLVVRVPRAQTAAAVERVRALGASRFVAAHGVGEVEVGFGDVAVDGLAGLRAWSEELGGALVVASRPDGGAFFDPWGTPPPSIELARRVKAAFDPAGIMNPGRLPGGL